MPARILVVGSANLDEFIQVENLPTDGATVFGTQTATLPGGKGLNQAVAAHRAGGDVDFVFSIGDDEAGKKLIAFLDSEGLRHRALLAQNLSSGRALITLDHQGRNQIIVLPGSNLDPTLATVELGQEPGYLVLQLEIGMDSVLALAQRAHESGWKVVLTPAPVSQLDVRTLEFVDLMVLNQSEIQEISGASTPIEGVGLLETKVGSIVLTLGEKGCLVSKANSFPVKIPAPVVAAVDSTGAGDTFCGYLVAELARGVDLVEAARTATAAAAISVQSAGASASIPTIEAVTAFLASNPAT